MISIPLALTPQHACSYLEGIQAQSIFVHPSFGLSTSAYAALMAQGFRRSGDDVYKPQCPGCSACVPVRLAVADFKPDRAQKRCLSRNASTLATIKPAEFEQAHYDMYLRYQTARHGESCMAESSPAEYIQFLGSSWCNTQFVEFSVEGRLAAVAIIDEFEDSLSAVYTFFEPELSHLGLGVYAVLWQIGHAQRLGKDFVYLGYWIKECRKMSYKTQYRPLQGLVDGQWIELPE